MIALYQFPVSHYCEKIRRAPDTCVPILDHDDRVIQGSDSIITYLDETFAEQSLTPATE